MKTHCVRLIFLLLSCWPALGADMPSALRVVSDIAFLAPDRKEKLNVYLPAPAKAGAPLAPAVVWIHGGGWKGGTKAEARAKNICSTLAAAGYVAVSIDYRLGPGSWPTNLQDCKNAVRFLRAHAAEYRLDPDRIAVAGGSAGGHLALMVGLTAGKAEFEPSAPYPGVSSAVRAVVNFYGIAQLAVHGQTDAKGEPTATNKLMRGVLAEFGASDDEAEVLRLASPVNYLTKNSPPLLTFHGKADATVDYGQAEVLDAACKAQGAAHELHLIDGIGHTFDLQTWNKKPLPQDLRPIFLAFLERNLASVAR